MDCAEYILDLYICGVLKVWNCNPVLVPTDSSWRTPLCFWWTLLTNLFPCEHINELTILPWYYSISFSSARLICPTEYGSFIYLSDCWPWWHCKLVSHTCWLVWSKVASKIIQVSGYYVWASEEYYGMSYYTFLAFVSENVLSSHCAISDFCVMLKGLYSHLCFNPSKFSWTLIGWCCPWSPVWHADLCALCYRLLFMSWNFFVLTHWWILHAVHKWNRACHKWWEGKHFIDNAWFTVFKSTWKKKKRIVLLLQKERQVRPCMWNGMPRPCYLFARKFHPDAADSLMQLFSSYISIWI